MIEQLIAETTDCDFREVVEHAKPKSWLKSVSAFANTKDGMECVPLVPQSEEELDTMLANLRQPRAPSA